MGWLGSVIGGGLGFLVGGPVGAAAGAGIGYAVGEGVDQLDNDDGENGLLPGECSFIEDDLGRHMKFEIHTQLPTGCQGKLHLLREYDKSPIKGKKPFADESGNFYCVSPFGDNECRFYVPFPSLKSTVAQNLIMLLQVWAPSPRNGDYQLFGASVFSNPFPRGGQWDKVEWLTPLIDLCMAVVHADEKVLPEEVRAVKSYFQEVFELENQDLDNLRKAMKRPPARNIKEVLTGTLLRVPMLNPPDIIQIMAGIAHSDGEVHPKEVELIKSVATEIGFPPSHWGSLQDALNLHSTTQDDYKVLGLDRGASAEEIRHSFRRLASEYHPDRVATLPIEFRELAHEKMTAINAAYNNLSRQT